MNKDSLKYAPIYPGRIQQFYLITPFVVDFVFFIGYVLFLKFFKIFNQLSDKKLDNKLREIVGKDRFIKMFADGRSSLLFALKSLNLNAGDEVIVSPNTCEVVCQVIISADLVPVFMATDNSESENRKTLMKYVSKKTKVILLTNTYGILDDYDTYTELSKKLNLVIINDLAQANLYDEATKNVIRKSAISILSFGPEKYLGAIGGGAFVSNGNKNNESTEGSIPDKEILGIIISRFKYWFTFLCYRFNLLKVFLLFNILTYEFSNYKNINSKPVTLINMRTMHQVVKLSVLFRFWLLKFYKKHETNNFALLKSLITNNVLFKPSTNSTPLFAVLNLKNIERNKLAILISKEEFQTLWNYVPLYEYENFSKYLVLQKVNNWENLLQVPFRFLSTKKINHLSQVICNNIIRNFFDRNDWIATLQKVFGFKKIVSNITISGEVLNFNLLTDGKYLYLNYLGYFNPDMNNLNEEKLLKLIDSIERKEGKKVVRMKLFPEIKLIKPSRFVARETQILDMSQHLNLTKNLRYEINKATKSNVHTRILTKVDISNFYEIYLETVDRVNGDYITPINLFYEIVNLPECFILGAFRDGKLLGGSVYLCTKEYAFYWWNATSHDGRKSSVNYLITNNAINLLREKSIRYLDFASSNNKEILKSKQKWGTEKVTYYEYLVK